MNTFEKLIYIFQKQMNEPTSYGIFHFFWIILSIFLIIKLYKINKTEKNLKIILGIYGIGSLILEILKQLIWSFNYEPLTNIVTWDYPWYIFPFQLCSTPMYICIFCLFLKKGKLRDALLSYIAYLTILGSMATMIYPESCFVSDILVNIHAMYLHFGSFIVSVYLLFSKEVKLKKDNFQKSLIVFLCLVCFAQILNITFYESGIINDETFNMFYISPYFPSSLPVFDTLYYKLPFIFYFLSYILTLILGSYLVYLLAQKIDKKLKLKKEMINEI